MRSIMATSTGHSGGFEGRAANPDVGRVDSADSQCQCFNEAGAAYRLLKEGAGGG